MSTIQISALPAASAITADDLLPIEHDPSGTPVTQKATAAIFAAGVRGIAGAYVTTNIVPSGATSLTINATQADVDVRIKGDTDAALVFLDAGTNRVGIGTATPTTLLDVSGTLKATAFTGSGASLTGLTGTAQEFQSLASDPASLTNGDVWYNTTSNTFKCRQNGATKTFTQSAYMAATGGTITTSGNYKIHTFTSSATFTVTSAGLTPVVEYLVVAGGGGGGFGGGGGGGYRTASGFTVSAQAYTITIGAGGGRNLSGADSTFSTITSIGGGSGGVGTGLSGGSGGGGGLFYSSGTGTGTSGQGYNGLGASNVNNAYLGGPGGGSAGVGTSASTTHPIYTAGNGGAGTLNTIDGNSYYYAGGGGGGCTTAPEVDSGPLPGWIVTGGNGGIGSAGGGKYVANQSYPTGSNGSASGSGRNAASGTYDAGANTGSAGGGSYQFVTPSGFGGLGGSGIIIIKYQYQ